MTGSLPRLDKIYDQYADIRDKFVIVGLCDDFVSNFDQYKPKADKLIKDGSWKRDLPFPVILDPRGQTWKAWQFGQNPFQVLIDPQGNLAAYGPEISDELLEQKLKH